LYLKFAKETSDALRRVETKESTIPLEGCNAHVENDAGVWKSVIGQHVDAEVNDNFFKGNS